MDITRKKFAIGTWELELQTPNEREYIFNSLLKACEYVDTAVNYNNDYLLAKLVPKTTKIISKIAPCHLKYYDFFVDNHIKCLCRDKIDIMLIHSSRGDWQPLAQKIESDSRFIEKGVSNFNVTELEEYKKLIGHYPAYNELEINPRYSDFETLDFCKKHEIKVIAYGIYGSKYNAMTYIADYSIPYLLKYALSFADFVILKPESERQTNEVLDVLDNYAFDDGNEIDTKTANADLIKKSVVPLRYETKTIKKFYKGVETYSIACGQNRENLVKLAEYRLPTFEMRGDYLAYVRYKFRKNYDEMHVYDYDFLIGDDGNYYVVHLYDEFGRITKIHVTDNEILSVYSKN